MPGFRYRAGVCRRLQGLHSAATKSAHPHGRGDRPGRWHGSEAAHFDAGSVVPRPYSRGLQQPVRRLRRRPLAALGRRRARRRSAAAGFARLSGLHRPPASGGGAAGAGGSGRQCKCCCGAGRRSGSGQQPGSHGRFRGRTGRLVLAAAHYALPSGSAACVRSIKPPRHAADRGNARCRPVRFVRQRTAP